MKILNENTGGQYSCYKAGSRQSLVAGKVLRKRKKYKGPLNMNYRYRGSHAWGGYPTQLPVASFEICLGGQARPQAEQRFGRRGKKIGLTFLEPL